MQGYAMMKLKDNQYVCLQVKILQLLKAFNYTCLNSLKFRFN